jgi:HlyD family secretion protein
MGAVWRKGLLYKKGLVLFGLIVVAGAIGMHYYFAKKSKPVFTGNIITVKRGDVKATVSATGPIAAVNSVAVSSNITGQIVGVKVHENDRVKRGQILYLLDSTALQSQVDQAKANLANAQANYERSKKLAAIGGEAMQQLDADRTTYEVDKATYDNAAAQLGYTVIRAPISGMVVGKPVPAGQTVSPGISTPMVLLTIDDLSVMQVQALVDEADIGSVKVGQKVDFTVDAYPGKTFSGVVSLISRAAQIETNVVYYTVYINVNNPQGLLFPTMTGRVTICTGEASNVPVIPLSAVKEIQGKNYVQKLVNGKPQNVEVKLGLEDDENAQVISGLEAGDHIVVPQSKPPAGAKGGFGGRGLRF